MKEKKEKAPTSAGYKVKTIIGTLICIILIPVLIINCTLIAKGFMNEKQVPDVGGAFPLIVLTDSMYPQIESGDLIFCKTAEADEIKEGDIISYFDPAGNGLTIITHRVIDIKTDNNGDISFKTKGDANNVEDQLLVPEEKLVGIYKSRVPGLGDLAMFMQKPFGMVLFILVPILIFIIYDVIRRRSLSNKEKLKTEELEEELRQLRELAALRNSDNKKDE